MRRIHPSGNPVGLIAMLLFAGCSGIVQPVAIAAQEKGTPEQQKPAAVAEEPAGLVRLAEKHDVWLDTKRKAVVIDGVVCLREGQLEMFACPKGTKEHESILALNCIPEQVHAGLLAAGAKPGKPVKFDPKYEPATGQVIDIYVLWRDEEGNRKTSKAQQWVKHIKTGKAMEYDWVFAGSGFWKDPESGKEYYQANGGDFICLSNFPTAMLDLPIESSQANADLLFHALTENIPPKGTKVRVVLIPRVPVATSTTTPAAESGR